MSNEEKITHLIQSLSKAEKRNFKMFIRRNNRNQEELKQTILFDIIERFGSIRHAVVKRELAGLSKKNLAELSTLLYRNILKSLRILQSGEQDYRIRETIDHAQLLYQRGLFKNSLELLAKAKQDAKQAQKFFLVYEIIDFEKKIESRHVTSSHQQRANELTEDAIQVRAILEAEGYWTELSLKLYDFYLKSGHTRSEAESQSLKQLFFDHRPQYTFSANANFYEQLYRYQSHVWYYYILQEFPNAYRYSVAWIDLFNNHPGFLQTERFQLLKGFHNCLSVLYFCQDNRRFQYYFRKMELFVAENDLVFDPNTRLIAFIYLHLARLNSVVLNGRFTESLPYLSALSEQLETNKHQLDHHRTMVFNYKIATIYFTAGEHRKCLYYLNLIINDNPKNLHEDVQSFARILNLITHYELGNFELIFSQVKSVYRFLLKLEETQLVQEEIIRFLRKSVKVPLNDIPLLFEDFYTNLKSISLNKSENRAFLYLDVLSWLESKMLRKPVELVIQEKRKSLLNKKQ